MIQFQPPQIFVANTEDDPLTCVRGCGTVACVDDTHANFTVHLSQLIAGGLLGDDIAVLCKFPSTLDRGVALENLPSTNSYVGFIGVLEGCKRAYLVDHMQTTRVVISLQQVRMYS